jgi:protoheme IX farnesyltransferase
MSSLAGVRLTLDSHLPRILGRLIDYFQLVKSLQTGLLLVTAVAGYISGCCLNITAGSLAALVGSLFLAVSGSTVLNMVYDRDIDACMRRTARRPLPSGSLSALEAGALGILLTASGLIVSFWMDVRYGAVVFLGVFFDVVIYTMLLKRRTPYSILIGGLAGGIPALAGRVLATGRVDMVGLLLAAGVLLWIPTHILTFSIKYREDYARANLPTFPAKYGIPLTQRVIAGSTLLAILVLFAAGRLIGLSSGFLMAFGGLGLCMMLLVLFSLITQDSRIHTVLYKCASLYMLLSMLLVISGGW